MLARIRANVSKRALTLACVAALVLAACGGLPKGTVQAGAGPRFVTLVADATDDVGLGNQVVVDSNGLPYISYWGFAAKLAPNAIPITRPIGAPFIPAVQVASLSKSNIWTRGAAAQVKDSPPGVVVPFGPATDTKLVGATADNTNGTDIAIGADGTKHVVWTAADGVYYATGTTAFTAQKLYDLGLDLSVAGPIGRPSVTLDSAGKPWVAYTVNAGTQQVRVETPNAAGKWITTQVASLPQCGGCPQPGVTRIGMTPAGPVVAYADPQAKKVTVATSTAGVWTTQQVASNVTGSGLALAVGKDGSVYLTYYAGDGSVQLATNKGGQWATSKVAGATPSPTASASPSASAPAPAGNYAETTGVAVDGSGKIYATYYDGASDSVKVVSGDGTTFAPIQTTDTQGGVYPSIAVTTDGSLVYVAWYTKVGAIAGTGQDLLMGVWGNQPSYAIGYLSPPPPPGSGPVVNTNCGADKKIALSEVAQGTAFKDTCLVAPAGKAFKIDFNNQDPVTTTGQHNIAIASDSQFAKFLFHGSPVSGPASTVYSVASLAAGTYYFHCDFHPTMQGSLVVVAGAK